MKPMMTLCRAALIRGLPAGYGVRLAAALIVCACTACGSFTAPTPPPVADPGAPKLSCSAAVTTGSPDGNAVAVTYPAPAVTAGALPLTGPACTPASGSLFN